MDISLLCISQRCPGGCMTSKLMQVGECVVSVYHTMTSCQGMIDDVHSHTPTQTPFPHASPNTPTWPLPTRLHTQHRYSTNFLAAEKLYCTITAVWLVHGSDGCNLPDNVTSDLEGVIYVIVQVWVKYSPGVGKWTSHNLFTESGVRRCLFVINRYEYYCRVRHRQL